MKSFGFSVLLCLVWGFFSVFHAETLLKRFEFTELLWFVYNVTISILFLIRVRPSDVSMNLVHWVVALITSFSGFIFSKQGADSGLILSLTADSLIVFAIVLGIVAALILGRSYDFLPALRLVKTGYAYEIVRHPMYLSSIIIKLGYVLKNPSIYNICFLMVITVLYDRRAKYEELIMARSDSYVSYLQQVKYRFMPGIY
ncbi:methyltransferase family protein [Candidatus Latescibacterota bacterium]